MAKYFRPKSWTWRAGIASIALGAAQLFFGGSIPIETMEKLGKASHIVSQLLGSSDSSPIGLITLGFGLIGVRRKLQELSDASDSNRRL